MEDEAAKLEGTRSIINDCWNRIGVRGDASCVELKQHVHCRNCPVYSAAASTLLDRDLPAEHLSDWAAHFAKARQIEEPDTHSAIIFRIASEWFALPTVALDEVAEPRKIHSLPHLRSGIVLGLINVRGELLVCVSLAKMLRIGDVTTGDPERQGFNAKRLVVVRHNERRAAFPVDEVQGIHRYQARELRAAPATITKASAAYTTAMLSLKDKTVGCLDDQLLAHALDKSAA
jgi:chemotaxis-related protein WspD